MTSINHRMSNVSPRQDKHDQSAPLASTTRQEPPKAARALTLSQASIIKLTVPVLADHGIAITTKFYHDLLTTHPSLKNIFNTTHQATGHQPRALAGALYAYAANIDDLGALSPALELICQKHVSLYVKPEQYDIVGKSLLEAMKSVLGTVATPAIMDAWGAAYWQLADLMIAKETQMYDETRYWAGWQDFIITRKDKETPDITSFYLEPVDAKLRVLDFKPGQYVSVNVFVEGLHGGVWQARQYSLSDAPGKSYLRISVKREEGVEIGEVKGLRHAGCVSSILHDGKSEGDVVRVSHPFGDFFLKEEQADSPVVLISAGVGLTCLTSILNTLSERGSARPVSWIHVARNASSRAFNSHIDSLAKSNRNLNVVHFSSRPEGEEVQGQHYHVQGRLDLDKVSSEKLFKDDEKTLYFVCGPTEFMLDVEAKLKTYGVPSERINMELFGTGGVPRV